MILYFDKETTMTFTVVPPLYLPFYNQWGANVYHQYDPFDMDPFHVYSSSTSGSPVVLSGSSFFGFLNEKGGRFLYDGMDKLTIQCAEGQGLYYCENCDPYAEWKHYNDIVLEQFEKDSDSACEQLEKNSGSADKRNQQCEDFWNCLEYCTWVDQKREAVLQGKRDDWACLNENYIYNYMRRVEKLGLPKGKLTIDDGWDVRRASDGRLVYGNWEVDRNKFPHMERLVKDMKEEGFIPGLWFAPFTATPNSELAKKYPHLLGSTFSQNAEAEAVRQLMFLRPDPLLEKYYTDIFSRYIAMGFRKFKLDMSYGNKADMKKLLAMIYNVIKGIDAAVEVEAHIPDIFVSRYCDTVRINDVNFGIGNWRAVTREHYKVCRYSSPHKILNLDHLGTNTALPKEDEFLAHTEMLLQLEGGYPCVSLLPDLFDKKAVDKYVGMVCEWNDNRGLAKVQDERDKHTGQEGLPACDE